MCCLSLVVNAAWTDEHARIHHLALKFQYESAAEKIDAGIAANKDDYNYYFLKGLNSFTKALIEAEPKFTEKYFEIIEECIEVLEEVDDDPFAIAFLGELRFYEAFIGFREEKELVSSYSFLKAYRASEELEENHPNFIPGYPLRILVESILSQVPENIQGYMEFFGFSGTQVAAEDLLGRLLNSMHEKKYNYLQLYAFFLSDYTRISFAQANYKPGPIPKKFSKQPLLLIYRALYYTNNRESAKALKLIAQLEEMELGIKPYFLNYLKGKSAAQLMRDDAHLYLKKFLEHTPSLDFVKSANMYLSYHYYLRGKTDLSEYYRVQIGKKGKTRTGFDSYAERMMNEPYHKELISSLLLFDAGELDKSEEILIQLEPENLKGLRKIERDYRLARIYQITENLETAKTYFKKALVYEKVDKDYMQPNCCLQLAKIYYYERNFAQTSYYVEQCLEYDGYPYDDGLRAEAKSLRAKLP